MRVYQTDVVSVGESTSVLTPSSSVVPEASPSVAVGAAGSSELPTQIVSIIVIVIKMIKTSNPPARAKRLNCLERFLSFFQRAVLVLIQSLRLGDSLPLEQFGPTDATSALQVPLMIRESDLRNGSRPYSRGPFKVCCTSSSSGFSSTFKSTDLMTMQSAGTLMPVSNKMTSPTTSFQTLTL